MLQFLIKYRKRNDACNIENAQQSSQDLNPVHDRSYNLPQIYHARIHTVGKYNSGRFHLLLWRATSRPTRPQALFSRSRLATRKPLWKHGCASENERATNAESQTNRPRYTKARDSYERHRKLYYIPGAFNMALQKLRVNCLIFVLARRQVRRVETKSEYESNKPLQGTIREREREILANCVTAFRGYFEFCKWIMSVLCFHFW